MVLSFWFLLLVLAGGVLLGIVLLLIYALPKNPKH